MNDYLRTGWAILLRVAPLVPTKEAGRGRALRLEEGVLGLLGRGILLLERQLRLTEEGIVVELCIVGLTYAVAFRGGRVVTEKLPTLWTRCCNWPGGGTEIQQTANLCDIIDYKIIIIIFSLC